MPQDETSACALFSDQAHERAPDDDTIGQRRDRRLLHNIRRSQPVAAPAITSHAALILYRNAAMKAATAIKIARQSTRAAIPN